MKKRFPIILVVSCMASLFLIFAGCAGKEADKKPNPTSTPSASATVSDTANKEDATESKQPEAEEDSEKNDDSKPSSTVKPTAKPTTKPTTKPSTSTGNSGNSTTTKPTTKPNTSTGNSGNSGNSTTPSTQKPTPHVHSYTNNVKQPTCTEQGYTLQTCSCGYSQKVNYTNAKGHSYGDWVVTKQPTTSSTGTKTRTCSTCKHTESQTINKLPAPTYNPTSLELQMLDLINQERAKVGANPLTYDYKRAICADVRVKEIDEKLSHTRPNGKDWITVLYDYGFNHPMACAENIQCYAHSVQESIQSFMDSPGHKANILDTDFTSVAIRITVDNTGAYSVVQHFYG